MVVDVVVDGGSVDDDGGGGAGRFDPPEHATPTRARAATAAHLETTMSGAFYPLGRRRGDRVTALPDLESARAAITALVLTYAERIDAGDFEGMAALFADATYRASTPGGIVSQQGAESVLATMRALVQTYDGVPSTKHVTTNLLIEIDEDGLRATCRSYFTVLQGRPGWGLQPIVAGRYHDAFVLGADGWQFTDRLIFTDLVGDVSHHLRGDVLG